MEGDPLIAKGRVRLFVQRQGLRTSEKVYAVLDNKIRELLQEAAKRAKLNNRSTLMDYDL